MFDYFHLMLFLLSPILLHPLQARRKGLVTGLFVSLLAWGHVNPWLVTVPFFVILFLSVQLHKHSPYQSSAPADAAAKLYIKKPSQPMFAAFLIIMSVFCAFGNIIPAYGNYLGLPAPLMQTSSMLYIAAFITGPIIFGRWCDSRGPFGAAVFLTLLAELSLWFIASGDETPAFWITGTFCMALTISGFFVLMPVIAETFWGSSHFLQVYPFTALTAALTWSAARYLYTSGPQMQQNPADLLITLIFLPLFAAAFIFLAWQRRFVLVAAAKDL